MPADFFGQKRGPATLDESEAALRTAGRAFHDRGTEQLIEHAIARREGLLAHNGALVVRWLGREDVVPLAQVEGVYSGQRLEALPRLRGLTWRGYWVGRGAHRGADLTCYSTSDIPAG